MRLEFIGLELKQYSVIPGMNLKRLDFQVLISIMALIKIILDMENYD